jgi:hypothetical protein
MASETRLRSPEFQPISAPLKPAVGVRGADQRRRISLVFSLAFHKESRSCTASSQPSADFLLPLSSYSSTVLNNANVGCLQRLLGDCSKAGGTRRFSRVNCWEVPKTCSGAFRTPGRCGLLTESSSQNGTEPPAIAIPAGLDSRTAVRRMADPAELA